MNTHNIRFSITADGEFEYNGNKNVISYIKAKKKDQISWNCTNGGVFSINFGWCSPFAKCHYQSDAAGTITVAVPDAAPSGDYKYTIAAVSGGKVWIDDPRIIIPPPEV